MKKPNYIEVRLPSRKDTANPAVKEYFKRLRNRTLFVNFGEKKQRKVFEYFVKETCLHQWYQVLKLKLKVPKEI